jgi:hypothetical protein
MALSNGLSQAGTPPTRLRTSAEVTFVPGTGITGIALTVVGAVPGLDEAGFVKAAEDAKANCPVSQAQVRSHHPAGVSGELNAGSCHWRRAFQRGVVGELAPDRLESPSVEVGARPPNMGPCGLTGANWRA